MPLDRVLVSDTREWLAKAYEDLDTAILVMRQKTPRIGISAFHTQQAAEKALKAFLTWKDQPFPKTHDLERLGKACGALDPGLAPVALRLASISDWAIETRYPGDWKLPTRSQVTKAIQDVRKLLREILRRLPKQAHP